MADEARLHDLLDLVEQARSEGDTATEQKAIGAYHAESRQALVASNPAEYDPQSPEFQSKFGPQGTTGENILAGAGKAFVDLGRGAGQYLGLVSRQDVANSRQTDAPLMATKAGKIGNFVGNFAATVPAIAIPGANTVVGAGLLGAGLGALQPSTSTGETLTNTAVGGAVGAGAQYLGGKVSNYVTGKLASRKAASSTAASLNSERDAVLQQAGQAGYVVPPTAGNPSATNTVIESVAGKTATRQVMTAKNATVTNNLVRQDLAMPANQPLTIDTIGNVIKREGQIYQQVKNVGPMPSDATYTQEVQDILRLGNATEAAYPGINAQANEKVQALVKSLDVQGHSTEQAVNAFKLLNERSKDNFRAAYGANGTDSQALELARAQRAGAEAIGDLIERHLTDSGQADLAAAWQNARTTIAKAYQAMGALRGNDVSAKLLANQLRAGKPVSGGMGIAARFANHFGEVAGTPASGAGASQLRATLVGGTALTTAAMGHPGTAAIELGASAVPYGLRGMMVTRGAQNVLARPNYGPSLLGTGALQAIGFTGRNALAPSIGLANTAKK